MPSAAPTLLVIEDEEDSLVLLTEVLENSGFTVRPCHAPLSALLQLETFRPAMILLDWNLPLMSGRTFLDRAREKLGELPPVVVLTGDTRLQAGGDLTRVLYKPFELDELLETVFALLAVRPERGASGPSLSAELSLPARRRSR
jgi:DNA-binding response OmpR family regulator